MQKALSISRSKEEQVDCVRVSTPFWKEAVLRGRDAILQLIFEAIADRSMKDSRFNIIYCNCSISAWVAFGVVVLVLEQE